MKRSVSDLNDSTSGVAGGLKAGPRDLSMRSDKFFSAQTSLNSTVTGKCFQEFLSTTFGIILLQIFFYQNFKFYRYFFFFDLEI